MEERLRRSNVYVQDTIRDAFKSTLFMQTLTHDSIRVLLLKLIDPFWCPGEGLSAAVPHVKLVSDVQAYRSPLCFILLETVQPIK